MNFKVKLKDYSNNLSTKIKWINLLMNRGDWMNSIERVKAAIHFKGPDKVPIMNFGMPNSDVFPLITMPSNDWNPGHTRFKLLKIKNI